MPYAPCEGGSVGCNMASDVDIMGTALSIMLAAFVLPASAGEDAPLAQLRQAPAGSGWTIAASGNNNAVWLRTR